ncbi:MAG: hypothetical protein GC206_14755 [Alphaproteobacteria bacterium]|nr:hypothetical protein [Alphaproteobacteria bacterium]
MSGEPPPRPDGEYESKLYAKRRMPFDASAEKPKRPVGVTAALVLYGAALVGCIVLAAFMHFGRGNDIASVPVLAPIGGAAWFLVRFLMTMRPMAPRE